MKIINQNKLIKDDYEFIKEMNDWIKWELIYSEQSEQNENKISSQYNNGYSFSNIKIRYRRKIIYQNNKIIDIEYKKL